MKPVWDEQSRYKKISKVEIAIMSAIFSYQSLWLRPHYLVSSKTGYKSKPVSVSITYLSPNPGGLSVSISLPRAKCNRKSQNYSKHSLSRLLYSI